MSDGTNFCYFGTPLPALEKPDGSVPAKRHPIRPEDQIVTDENGKRRFHGAFTGGFSAGYWNTVGSQEGWTPQSFKSSRSEKAPQRQQQRPEDFMDDEDRGEFGIAPKKVQVRPEFAMDSIGGGVSGAEGSGGGGGGGGERKRKLQQPQLPSSGPIPGQPVLCQLLKSGDVESVAVRIMKLWGWRPGRGVGPRQTRKEKQQARERNKREMYVLERYGCDVESQARRPIGYDDSEDDDDEAAAANASAGSDESEDDGLTYAPEDFEPRPAVKENQYGLGYTPLSRDAVLAQDILAPPPTRATHVFEVVDKNNVKFSITGQAFGVGALEDDDDEEVYHREDWSKYDYTLEDEQKRRHKERRPAAAATDTTVLEGFAAAQQGFIYRPYLYKVDVPPDFRPRNWAERRSRFEPLDPRRERTLNAEQKRRSRLQPDITPEERGQLLGEQPPPPPASDAATTSAQAIQPQRPGDDKAQALLARLTRSDHFTAGGIITPEGEERPKHHDAENAALQTERDALRERALGKTKHLATSTASGAFKPFAGDKSKQRRYEQFLDARLTKDDEIAAFLRNIQPVHLSEWDREMERKEFVQARSIYKPLDGLMSDRFVSEAALVAEPTVAERQEPADKAIIMQRTCVTWKPNSLLCKRYNIAEPHGGHAADNAKPQSSRAKMSIFDYLETSVNRKSDFHTPVIIPKHVEQPRAIVRTSTNAPAATPPAATTLTAAPSSAVPPATSDGAADAVAAAAPPPVTASSARAPPTKGFVARTDLQKRVVASIDTPAADKLQLFKSIFDDSDDEAADDAAATSNDANETEAQQNAPPPPRATTAAAANLLRNTSPPRGIFAALFHAEPAAKPPTSTPTDDAPTTTTTTAAAAAPPVEAIAAVVTPTPPKIAFKPRNERMTAALSDAVPNETPPADNVYGPKLPERTTPQSDDVEAKILQFLQKHKEAVKLPPPPPLEQEQWVERKRSASSDSASDSSASDQDSDSSSADATHDKRRKSAKKSAKHKTKERHKKRLKRDKKHKHKKSSAHKTKKSKKSKKSSSK